MNKTVTALALSAGFIVCAIVIGTMFSFTENESSAVNAQTASPVVSVSPLPTAVPTEAPTVPPSPVPTSAPTEKIVPVDTPTEPPAPVMTEVSGVVFYGDSWMDNNFFRKEFGSGNTINAKGSQWAKYFVENNLIQPADNAKAVFVQFGLNDWQTAKTGLSDSSYMKRFLDKLTVVYPGIPIIISGSPHTALAYVSNTGNNINPRCDTYSKLVSEYCSAHDNFYYADTTSCLEDENGWLKYADSSAFHLTPEGYGVWFSKIRAVILETVNIRL